MDVWLKAARDVLELLLGEPATAAQGWTILAMSFIACIIVLKLMGGAVGGTNAFIDSSVICSLIGFLLVLVCLTAVKMYVPRDIYLNNCVWLLPAAGVVLSLIVIAPLISAIMKTGYIGALTAWVVSLIVVAGIILLAGALLDAIEAGEKDATKIRRRRDALEEILQ